MMVVFRLGFVEGGSLPSSYCVESLLFFQRHSGLPVSSLGWNRCPQLSSSPAGRPVLGHHPGF